MADLTKLQARIDAMLAKSHNSVTEEPAICSGVDVLPETLPAVSEHKRVVPNALLRGSLFGVVGKGERKYEQKTLKASVQGLTVKFTGQQLDQADLDVYLECIRRCGTLNIGKSVRFRAYDFLKSIGRNTGRFEYVWLDLCLNRLFSCAIEIGDGRFFYTGHILDEGYRDEETKEFIISLNPKIAVFFSDNVWTGLSHIERRELKGKSLAQWLHGFYSTHTKPFPYKVGTIKELCGSDIAELRMFKFKLKKSLSALSKVTGWQCWIDENDLVNVIKK